TLIKIGYFWGILVLLISLVVIGVVVANALPDDLIPVLIVCAILILLGLILVGYVGLLVLVYKFHKLERIGLYDTVFILLILAPAGFFVFEELVPYAEYIDTVVSSVISLVAWILLYVALGKSIRRAQQAPPTPPQPTAPPV
ncbi:MAG: hypothetical protein ACO2OR_06735, partial [Desulfurococcaceae archaeon]